MKRYIKTFESYILLENWNEIPKGKTLYHTTDINNALNILKNKQIKTYENVLKDVGEDPLDWYDDPEYGKFVYTSDFIHNDSNYYGLSDLEVTFVIDSNKIETKIYQADKTYEGGTIKVEGNIPLSCIEKVILYKSNDNLINLLSNVGINYEIVN